MPPVSATFAAQLLADAPDPFGLKSRPTTAAQWLDGLAAAGVAGAVGDLHHLGAFEVTADDRARQAQLAAAARLEAGFQRASAAEALAALHSAGIVAAQLKGTGLADRVYPAGWVRRATDVDLIVAPAELEAALSALAVIGYSEASPALGKYYRRHHHDVPLRRELSPPLDLHAAGLAGLGTLVPCADLLRADGALDPAAEVVYLAAHGAAHLFERPLWVLDIALAVAAAGSLNLSHLDAIADRWHLRRAWRIARIVVHRQLGRSALPWPPPQPTAADQLALRARARYLRLPAKSLQRFAAYTAASWALCDSARRAVWMAQFSALRAVGDVARKRGVSVPPGWPPWVGRPAT